MLRITQNSNAAGAISYYSTADYYSEGQELAGEWRGLAAERLGLKDRIDRAQWDALCDNRDPASGGPLTQRRKSDRSIGYDFNFHVPKSVSLIYGLTHDERILSAFRDSVRETMDEIEREMKTRVRAGGRNEDRTTGNMAWGEFIHFTARPVDGIPDPHLHAHCFVFNSTYDEQESRWKAGQFRDLKRDAPFFEAVFHTQLAHRLGALGLAADRTKTGWEVRGVPSAALAKFSRRTALIEDRARDSGIIDPELKSTLGARTRERKQKDLSLDALREQWRSRMTPQELEALDSVVKGIGRERIGEDEKGAREAALRAVEHCFERASVLPERRLQAEALKRAVGTASAETVLREVKGQDLLIGERAGRRIATTRGVLSEERTMIGFARDGRGSCRALGDPARAITRDWLNDGQRRAVKHVLGSRDRVILIRGAAGVGKTAMAKEAVEGIEAGGHQVFMFAPSADASRGVLRSEGFENADTVARLLKDEALQSQVRGQVLWVDEAGLLGTRTTGHLFDLAGKLGARIILSGDRFQHAAVERGAALRLLEEEAGLVPAEIKEIQRQKGDYKEAVRALSEGRTADGFDRLSKLGWIKEVGDDERFAALATDYVSTVEHGKSALVVSPTHAEGKRITAEIRGQLTRRGKLGQSRKFATLDNANLTEAERQDPVNYSPGDCLVYHQNAPGRTKGERVVVGDGALPLDQAGRFQVFHSGTLDIAPGDILRITRNGTTADGAHRLNNGALHTVKGFNRRGDLVLSNGWTIDKDFGHLAHGYVVTSHASQGKTVDRVFIGQSAASFPASSKEQFYVSVSRGRERAIVYTDDKEGLLEAVSDSDERPSATELVAGHRGRGAVPRRAAEIERPAKPQEREGPNHDR